MKFMVIQMRRPSRHRKLGPQVHGAYKRRLISKLGCARRLFWLAHRYSETLPNRSSNIPLNTLWLRGVVGVQRFCFRQVKRQQLTYLEVTAVNFSFPSRVSQLPLTVEYCHHSLLRMRVEGNFGHDMQAHCLQQSVISLNNFHAPL